MQPSAARLAQSRDTTIAKDDFDDPRGLPATYDALVFDVIDHNHEFAKPG